MGTDALGGKGLESFNCTFNFDRFLKKLKVW